MEGYTSSNRELLGFIDRVLTFRPSFKWSYRLSPNRLNDRNITVVKRAGINEVRSVYELKVYTLFNKQKLKQSLFNTFSRIPIGKKRLANNSFMKNNLIIKGDLIWHT